MENVFSQLVASDRIARLPKHSPGRYAGTYKRAREDFLQVLVELLREACSAQKCDYHRVLVEALRAGDSIISFNYDCLIDQTLADHGRTYGRWDPGVSYGYPVTGGEQFWGGRPTSRIERPIRLLKPHGSLNWRLLEKPDAATELRLRRDPYVGSAEGRVIPPIASKDIDPQPFLSVWAGCRDALAAAQALVVVGYSASDADALAQALLRLELASDQSRGLKALVLVDPAEPVRLKIRELCGPLAVRVGRTSVHSYDRFEDLAAALS